MNDVESRQQEHDETKLFLQFLNSGDETIDFKEWKGLLILLDKIKSLNESSEIIIHYCRNYCGIWLKDVTEFSADFGRNIPLVFESSQLVSKNGRTFTKHKDTIQEAIYTTCLKFVNYYINGR